MYVIGLTGNFGSGKSTVGHMFKRCGSYLIDADQVVHVLLKSNSPCYRQIVHYFGKGILSGSKINRAALAAEVFGHPHKLKILTNILHPAAWEVIHNKVLEFKKQKRKAVVIEAPLLIEAGWDKKVDVVIVVRSNVRQQLERVSKRMAISRSQFLKRIRSQFNTQKKMRRADFVIDNRGSLRTTRRQVQEIWNCIAHKCSHAI